MGKVNERKHKTITVADSKGTLREKSCKAEERKDNVNKFWKELNRLLAFRYALSTSYNTDHKENTMSDISSIVASVFVAAGVCLPSHCLAMVISSGFTIPAC
jgi:hypothetical protein